MAFCFKLYFFYLLNGKILGFVLGFFGGWEEFSVVFVIRSDCRWWSWGSCWSWGSWWFWCRFLCCYYFNRLGELLVVGKGRLKGRRYREEESMN